jgi:hypothetical protein
MPLAISARSEYKIEYRLLLQINHHPHNYHHYHHHHHHHHQQHHIFNILQISMRHTVHSWLRHCTTGQVAGPILGGVIGIFQWLILLATLWPWCWLSLYRNEYQDYLLGRKGCQCVGLTKTYHLHVPIFLKSGSLNILEPSQPVQACVGIAIPFIPMI